MLEKDMSILRKDNGNGVTRPRKYSELSATEAIQADCDVKATNIILHGIYPQRSMTCSNHRSPKELLGKNLTSHASQVVRAEEPPTSFDELNDTSFDFSAFIMNRLKIPNLTQEILVGPAFNLLKGTCKSITELEYHIEECSKATTERLNWYNPENKPYLFDLKKPLPLIQDHRGHQIIPKDYFINNYLEYMKGGDLSRRYSTSVTKTKAANYELKWIKDLVPELWNPMQLKYDQHAYFGTSNWGPKRQSVRNTKVSVTSIDNCS
ncbi:hypothetical protein Tco_0189113 [Tanacetum coccineum]